MQKKTIAIYGAGVTAQNSSQWSQANFVLSNNPNQIGTSISGKQIYSPNYLKSLDKENLFIYIASTDYEDIERNLEHLGLIRKKHFGPISELKFLETRRVLDNLEGELLVSVNSSYKTPGLYLYSFRTKRLSLMHGGMVAGFCFIDNTKLAVTDQENSVIKVIDVLTNKATLIDCLPSPLDLHGISWDQKTKTAWVVASKTNQIFQVDLKKNAILNTFNIGKQTDKDVHHVNDILVDADTLYISMFSFKGTEYRGLERDGVILKTNRDFNKREIFIKDLDMPHSICKVKNKVFTCSSNELSILSSKSKYKRLRGYTRGLDYYNEIFFVGISEHRNPNMIKIKYDYPLLAHASIVLLSWETNIEYLIPFYEHKNIYQIQYLPEGLKKFKLSESN